MQDKAIIIMEPCESDSNERACLYLERSVFGIVSLINMFNMRNESDYQLYIIDDDGGSVKEQICSNYKMFKLPKNFSLKGEMHAELYAGEKLILSGRKFANPKNLSLETSHDFFIGENLDSPLSAKEWASKTGQADLYEKAINMIERYKSTEQLADADSIAEPVDNDYQNITKTQDFSTDLPNCANEVEKCKSEDASLENLLNEGECVYDFYDVIGLEFESLFEIGKREDILEKIFTNSQWSKLLIDDRYICLGKIYRKSDYSYGTMPDIVALAIPMMQEKQSQTLLGKHSTFVRVNTFNDFGFMVLLQEARTGKAIKIIKNKG